MTLKKYSRLTLVSILPLFLVGYLAAKFIWPYDPYVQIICAPFSLTGYENCRDIGNGAFYESVRGQHPAWFDVRIGNYDENAYLHVSTEASARSITGAEIASATPFLGNSPDVDPFVASLSGRNAVINLGIPDGKRSFITDQIAILYCNDIRLDAEKDEYTSGCFGDGWSASVTYHVYGKSREEIRNLRGEIQEQITERQSDYRIYRIFAYPIFLYAYFLFSLLSYIFMHVVRFVNKE